MTQFVVTLDLEGVTDKSALMDRCADALGLPDWFGRNWDALADSLTDLQAPPGDGGLQIVVRNWRPYAEARPQEWVIAQDVFAQAVDQVAGAVRAARPRRILLRPPELLGRSVRASHRGRRGRMKYVLLPLADLSGGHL